MFPLENSGFESRKKLSRTISKYTQVYQRISILYLSLEDLNTVLSHLKNNGKYK